MSLQRPARIYERQFTRLAPSVHLCDGAPVTSRLGRILAGNAMALKGNVLGPHVLSDGPRTTEIAADTDSLDRTLIEPPYPSRPIPAGYRELVVSVRARLQSGAGLSATIAVYSDSRPPVDGVGDASVSSRARVLEMAIEGTLWAYYVGSLPIVLDRHGATWLSVWGEASVAGASNQAEITQVDAWCKPLVGNVDAEGLLSWP